MYVFADADDLKKLLEPLQEIALRFKSKVGRHDHGTAKLNLIFCCCINLFRLLLFWQIMFINVDIREENLAKPFLTLFGLEESDDIVVSTLQVRLGKRLQTFKFKLLISAFTVAFICVL